MSNLMRNISNYSAIISSLNLMMQNVKLAEARGNSPFR